LLVLWWLPAGTGRAEGPATPAAPTPAAKTGVSIEVDLTQQKAYLLLDGKPMYEARICSGRPGHLTPTGNFTVLEKDQSHFSSLYGKMLDASGKVVDWNADSDMPVPKGGKFVAAPMEYFLRFDGANGLHAGIIQSYAASHGCVRLPHGKAILFFNTASVGTPVHIFGTAPLPPQQATPVAQPSPSPTPADTQSKWFPWIKRLRG
jgi:lipoprotein-anchoring transpeptidase ErfK/SrfK